MVKSHAGAKEGKKGRGRGKGWRREGKIGRNRMERRK